MEGGQKNAPAVAGAGGVSAKKAHHLLRLLQMHGF
jgi:hypothetical protein